MEVHHLTNDERFELINADYDSLRRKQSGRAIWVVSQQEGELLWDATLTAFVHGNWIAAVLCAQATSERALAGLINCIFAVSEPPAGWERWGFGSLIRYCREERLAEEGLLDQLEVLCEERKPFGHWREPLASGGLLQIVLAAQKTGDPRSHHEVTEAHLADLAYRSTRTALLAHFGDLIAGAPATPIYAANATPQTRQ